MPPTPTEDTDNAAVGPTSTAIPNQPYWTKSTIGVTAVFALLALAIIVLLLVFYLRRQSDKKKKREHHQSARAGLLDNEDKTSMFSRDRHSSVTLYVDSEAEAQSKTTSQESFSLLPLQITPVEQIHDPMNRTIPTTASNGSGVSVISRLGSHGTSNGSGISGISRLSSNTANNMMLSPISPNGDEGDLSIRPSGRPRSVSSVSVKARYYEATPTNVDIPPIPRIVRIPSD
ncbi:hypothetical protein GQ44DRAFT_605506 [Phaeosphaeriaceae sp. PMI808]|nr:hypothetical protein GQ44DRAFT_605506 [Phaeosphaeriaceae sp. PMI808]